VYVDALIERDRSTQNNGRMDERLYAQQDANWNVTTLVNTSGSVVERYVYDPYGKPTFLNASWSTISGSAYAMIYLFQGGRYDTTSMLYNLRMRHYSPSLGRWIQTDPMGYAAGDVDLRRAFADELIVYNDPTGEILPILFVVAGAAAGWWLLGPGVETANAPAPGQEGYIPPQGQSERILSLEFPGLQLAREQQHPR